MLFVACSPRSRLQSLGYENTDKDFIRAIDDNNLAAVEVFIKERSFSTVKTKERIPLVNRAVYNEHYKLALRLIEAGASTSVDDGVDGVPLYIALSKLTDESNPDLDTLMRRLLLNEKWHGPINQKKQTLLMLLAEKGKIEMVKIVLLNGAQKGRVDSSGKRAFDYALENRHKSIADLLQ
jgi:ankyrin repeat protein